jgi:hypothetical protein
LAIAPRAWVPAFCGQSIDMAAQLRLGEALGVFTENGKAFEMIDRVQGHESTPRRRGGQASWSGKAPHPAYLLAINPMRDIQTLYNGDQ